MDSSAREGRRQVSDGGRRDRGRLDRAHRLSRYHPSVGRRLGLSWSSRSAQNCATRPRPEYLSGPFPLRASEEEKSGPCEEIVGAVYLLRLRAIAQPQEIARPYSFIDYVSALRNLRQVAQQQPGSGWRVRVLG